MNKKPIYNAAADEQKHQKYLESLKKSFNPIELDQQIELLQQKKEMTTEEAGAKRMAHLETLKSMFIENNIDINNIEASATKISEISKEERDEATENYVFELFAETEIQAQEIKELKEQLAEKDKIIMKLQNKLKTVIEILKPEVYAEEAVLVV